MGIILSCLLNPCLSYKTQLTCHLFQEVFPDPTSQITFLPPLARDSNINLFNMFLP